MNKRERTKMLNHLTDVRESISYIQERVRLADGLTLDVVKKNLRYALKKQEEVCKTTGYGDLTNLSTTLQRLEGKA